MAARCAYLWEFTVRADRLEEFQREYRPQGSWVAFFRRAGGYIDSVLLRDSANPGRFVTIDRWQSAEAYRAFRAAFAEQYAELDRRCERLTVQETALGAFEEADV